MHLFIWIYGNQWWMCIANNNFQHRSVVCISLTLSLVFFPTTLFPWGVHHCPNKISFDSHRSASPVYDFTLITGDVTMTSTPETMMSTPEAMTSAPEAMTPSPEAMTPISEISNRSDPIVAIGAGVGGALVVFILLVIIVGVLVLVVSGKRKAEKSDQVQVHQDTCTLIRVQL
jgi:hypothetical protein